MTQQRVLIHTDKSGAKWFAPVLPYTQLVWADGKLVYDRDKRP